MEKEWVEAVCQMQPFPFLTQQRQMLFERYEHLPHYHLERQTMRPFYPKQVFDFGEDDSRVYNFIDSDQQLIAVTHDGDLMVEQRPRTLAEKGVMMTSLFEALAFQPEKLEPYIGTLMTLDTKESAFHYMMMNHGLWIYIPDDTVIDEPILIEALESQSEQTLANHIVIVVGNHCQVAIHHHHQGSGERYFSEVVECFIGQNSQVTYEHLDDSDGQSRHYVERHFQVGRDSHCDVSLVSLGAHHETERMFVTLKETGATTRVKAAMTSRKRQNKGINVIIQHDAPHTHSELVQHGVVFDRGTLIANADSIINEHTPKATAKQETKIMMMTDKGKADANPMLEIHHNDVKVSHSASISPMDENILYYMMLRGIPYETARQLYAVGFLNVIVPKQWRELLEGEEKKC